MVAAQKLIFGLIIADQTVTGRVIIAGQMLMFGLIIADQTVVGKVAKYSLVTVENKKNRYC
ncbi:hypothetical protein BDV40DRAFT_255100 [Aspergillus tamarii]|uniref:Uncharacterized protein n=1 Tax=Aspergillus tamarii TaxID=41984 RepID=A0A5N6V6G6_ASPTM|nr:hypothetical protein BDV40DRAFT_255100 [Aspergillus tamarii]